MSTFYERKQQRDRLVELFNKSALAPQEIDRRLREFAKDEGEVIYTDLFSTLTHLDLPEAEARQRWENILCHQRQMSEKMTQTVDIRVATLDYLLTIEKMLDNPKIVEIRLFERTTESAITDGLTELYNMRYFRTCIEREVARATRHEKPFAVLMIDLDGFKPYNDACGHQAGDDALHTIGRILMHGTRSIDIVARYGGDEFVLLLPENTSEGAFTVSQRLIDQISGTDFPGGTLTVSIGISTFPDNGPNARSVLLAADRALYQSKQSGKNRVALAAPSDD